MVRHIHDHFSLSPRLSLTVLDVLPEDPELGVVLKRDKAALSRWAHLSTNHNTGVTQTNQRTIYFCVCVCVGGVTLWILPR